MGTGYVCVSFLMYYKTNTWPGHELWLIVQKYLTSPRQFFHQEELFLFQNISQDLFLLIVVLLVSPLVLYNGRITALRFLILQISWKKKKLPQGKSNFWISISKSLWNLPHNAFSIFLSYPNFIYSYSIVVLIFK